MTSIVFIGLLNKFTDSKDKEIVDLAKLLTDMICEAVERDE